MDTHGQLPFKVGDKAESKSFEKGYRGAWFRCKIKEIRDKRGNVSSLLEFFDYPDDKPRWTQLYQKLPYRPKPPQMSRQLMVRPSFPSVYHESEAPHPSTISDVVVVHGTWKVGDLADWWYEGCYWSGTISEVYRDGNYEIRLLEPPFGEGQSYKTDFTCLRPSLDWSLELGWTVPHSQRKGAHHTSIHLIYPGDRDVQQSNSVVDNSRALPSPEIVSSMSSTRSPTCFTSLDDKEEIEIDSEPDDSQRNTSSGTTDSSNVAGSLLTFQSHSGEALRYSAVEMSQVEHVAPAEVATGQQNPVIGSCKRPREDISIVDLDELESSSIKAENIPERSQCNRSSESGNSSRKVQFDSVELSILELEELANKIKWLQGSIKYGANWPKVRPSWNFIGPG